MMPQARPIAERFFQGVAGASGVLQLDMPGFVAVNIAEGAVELFQRDFDTALNVGNVVAA